MLERWAPLLVLLPGFLWLRLRARRMPPGDSLRRAGLSVFLVLGPLLMLGKWGFARLPFGPYTNLSIELASLAAAFTLTGLLFRVPKETEDNPAD